MLRLKYSLAVCVCVCVCVCVSIGVSVCVCVETLVLGKLILFQVPLVVITIYTPPHPSPPWYSISVYITEYTDRISIKPPPDIIIGLMALLFYIIDNKSVILLNRCGGGFNQGNSFTLVSEFSYIYLDKEIKLEIYLN